SYTRNENFSIIWRFSCSTLPSPFAPNKELRMTMASRPALQAVCGVRIHGATEHDVGEVKRRLSAQLASLGLGSYIAVGSHDGSRNSVVSAALLPDAFRDLTPGFDTTRLCDFLGLAPAHEDQDLKREIVLALLASPLPFSYPSFEE